MSGKSSLFREYIGTNLRGDTTFTDVPINPNVEFHFIVSPAIDYTTSQTAPTPNNGLFSPFWKNLPLADVISIKNDNQNVKVILSLGGDTVYGKSVVFEPTSVDKWVHQAVSSLTRIISNYKFDGIDINYQHFGLTTTPRTFAKCIGQLITTLREKKVISYASIAPTSDVKVQNYYMALWGECGKLIDHVNFKFSASAPQDNLSHFLEAFNNASANYVGGKVLPGFISDETSGLSVDNGFFEACKILKMKDTLHGIFAFSADISKARGTFEYEEEAQLLVANEIPN